ncbi:hypothetical protein UFOVP1290_278 [uncultured Caudovirales phage]|uniref:Uncharacterized protein n=1 Tax=uncultured Caudovirales phage TaxID=2100421 RepID=A0A6J5RT36_9CAUD|nr:hypothetical protein UFOVP1290_278 [uncultured Caudovirales phage]
MSQNEDTKTNVAQTVLAEVADVLKTSPTTVRSRLVSSLVEREVTRRVDLLDKGLNKLKTAKKELDKVKPDVETFSEAGEKLTATFSKVKFEERKKALEVFEKLSKAVEAAFAGEAGDCFNKLEELVK